MGQVAAWLDEDKDDGLSLVRCCLAQLPIIRLLSMAALHVGCHRNAPSSTTSEQIIRGVGGATEMLALVRALGAP